MFVNPRCTLLELHGVPIFDQLRLEEALLRCSDRNFFLINRDLPKAAVLGISRSPDEDLWLPRLRADQIPIIKRYSGGGTVLLDVNSVMVSWILSTPLPSPQTLLNWSLRIYEPIFPTQFRIREHDYTLGDKKIGGNAQYLQRTRCVHHTTFLWDLPEALAYYLPLPSKQPAYRRLRSHEDFLTGIHPYFDSKEEFISEIKRSASVWFHWETIEDYELYQLCQAPHRHVTCYL